MQEWNSLQSNDYKLRFRYPTEEEKKQLRVINKELQGKDRSHRQNLKLQREQLLRAVERGDIDPDQLILELECLKKTTKR